MTDTELDHRDAPEPSQWAWNRRSEGPAVLARFVSEPALEGIQALALPDAKRLREGEQGAGGDVAVARGRMSWSPGSISRRRSSVGVRWCPCSGSVTPSS